MTDKIRWGILSTANIAAKRVIPAIKKSSNGTVTAVASRDQSRADAFAKAHDIPTAHGTYEALLADENVDAIYLPLPNSMHFDWAMKCADAKKPTLCEKPLAPTADEARQMVRAFRKAKINFAVGFMYRFHPQTDRVKALIDGGAIGALRTINATFSFSVSDDENIRLSKDLAGGALMDVGCYCVNSMRYLTGEEPIKAQAFAQFGETSNVDETTTGILEFPSGVLGHFDASLRAHRTHMYDIRGTEGRIQVPTAYVPDLEKETSIHVWRGDTKETIVIPPADHYQLMVEDFAESILKKRPPRFHPHDSVNNMRTVQALLQVAERSKSVTA